MNGRVSSEKTAERSRLVRGIVEAGLKCIREPQSRNLVVGFAVGKALTSTRGYFC